MDEGPTGVDSGIWEISSVVMAFEKEMVVLLKPCPKPLPVLQEEGFQGSDTCTDVTALLFGDVALFTSIIPIPIAQHTFC